MKLEKPQYNAGEFVGLICCKVYLILLLFNPHCDIKIIFNKWIFLNNIPETEYILGRLLIEK